MDRTPINTDPDTGEVVRLLCHFTIQTSETIFNLQVYARKWYDFSGRQTPHHTNTKLLPPGVLKRLPPEIRFMIYDFSMPPKCNYFDLVGHPHEFLPPRPFVWSGPYFPVPKIAHVCQEMSRYAMQKYQFIWFRYTAIRTEPVLPFFSTTSYISWADPVQDIAELAIWTSPPVESRIGFFNPAKDSIQVYLDGLESVHLIQDATVQWSDPFQAPTLSGDTSTQEKKYSTDSGSKTLNFIPKPLAARTDQQSKAPNVSLINPEDSTPASGRDFKQKH
ncbi:hypothetical protein GGR50DRAFT_638852 [Xylaria sp. CBS 124048]|nr:hypothetical protein GGR50DRAFT_638852 [Xylaria sp. CBS 124048]